MSVRSLWAERSDFLRTLRAFPGAGIAAWWGGKPHVHAFGEWERSRLRSRLEHRFVMVRRCRCGAVERLPAR